MLPTEIGPYRIDRQIGRGGMGTVYCGRHNKTGAPAAVKVLPASLAREEGFVLRFSREIEAMKLVDSPNIVDFFESGRGEDETYYYAMEFVDGETLTSLLRREHSLSWQKSVDFAMQIASALKAVHAANVVHRDLKPSNLMISRQQEVKLTDFGVAHLSVEGTRLTKTGGVIGTAEFMSPEQARGVRASKSSDLYSLGAVLYAMLTGRPPFTGKNAAGVIHAQQYHQPDKPSRYVAGIPHGLESLVLRLLEKRPERRPEDASFVIRELNSIRQTLERAQEDDVTLDGAHRLVNAGAPTMALDSANASGPAPESDASVDGEGTILERLLRSKFRREREVPQFNSLFNSTWFLTGILAILLATVWCFMPTNLTPAEKIAEAESILEQPAGSSWLTAQSLLRSIDDVEWKNKTQPLLDRIELWEQSQTIRRLTARTPIASSEPERLLMEAQSLVAGGRIDLAEQKLTVLVRLLNDDERYADILRVAARILRRLRQAGAAAESRLNFVQNMIQRANQLQQDNDIPAARRIWHSLLEIYESEESLTEPMQTCRDGLMATGGLQNQDNEGSD